MRREDKDGFSIHNMYDALNYPWANHTQKDLQVRITKIEYNKMFKAQKGCCAICGRHQSEFGKRLAVDHNHLTGKIRGLLCNSCNLILGHAKDSRGVLLRAMQYLRNR